MITLLKYARIGLLYINPRCGFTRSPLMLKIFAVMSNQSVIPIFRKFLSQYKTLQLDCRLAPMTLTSPDHDPIFPRLYSGAEAGRGGNPSTGAAGGRPLC